MTRLAETLALLKKRGRPDEETLQKFIVEYRPALDRIVRRALNGDTTLDVVRLLIQDEMRPLGPVSKIGLRPNTRTVRRVVARLLHLLLAPGSSEPGTQYTHPRGIRTFSETERLALLTQMAPGTSPEVQPVILG